LTIIGIPFGIASWGVGKERVIRCKSRRMGPGQGAGDGSSVRAWRGTLIKMS
jgi:hypothetical protein